MKTALSNSTLRMMGVVAVGSLALSSVGCIYKRVVHDGWSGMREFADPPIRERTRRDRPPLGAAETGWAILIKTFEGQDRHERAQALVGQLHQANVPDLWVKDELGLTHVYRKRYRASADESAQADLRHMRTVRLGGDQRFEHVRLVPLGPEAQVSDDPLDLRLKSGGYSLQVAYYDDQFGPDFRQAAETAVKILRADGIEAYYYHGPHRSLVTVGVYGDDAVVQVDDVMTYSTYSLYIKQIQQQFPYNLGNGRTLVEKQGGKKIRDQPSFLVRIP